MGARRLATSKPLRVHCKSRQRVAPQGRRARREAQGRGKRIAAFQSRSVVAGGVEGNPQSAARNLESVGWGSVAGQAHHERSGDQGGGDQLGQQTPHRSLLLRTSLRSVCVLSCPFSAVPNHITGLARADCATHHTLPLKDPTAAALSSPAPGPGGCGQRSHEAGLQRKGAKTRRRREEEQEQRALDRLASGRRARSTW